MFLRLVAVLFFFAAAILPQQSGGSLNGRVLDSSGAAVPGAVVQAIGADGAANTTTTALTGEFTLAPLAPGRYTVRAEAPGFAPFETTVEIAAGKAAEVAVSLTIAAERQEITVQAEAGPQVSTEPSQNAGALVLRGADLDALSDDPDDLAADLQALAGPSAGPNGPQIFVDGFSGARLPPKASIREVRINQNPFSAEYDRLGFGRIEILTRPGTDRFRGQAFFNFGDESLNSRNPFAANRAPFQMRMFGGNLSGPLTRRSSFFLDLERREIDDNAVINATVLDPALNITPLSQAVLTPQRRTVVSPRLDYQLSQNHTLVARYTYMRSGQEKSGIGEFSLLSRAFDTRIREHEFQLTETAVLSPRAINETRFQFERRERGETGDNSIPAINVLESFMGGGAQVGRSLDTRNRWELQNYTSMALGTHGLKAGVRLRGERLSDISPQNFGGTFTFGGGLAPVLDANNEIVRDASGQPVLEPITSLERYRRTLLFQQQGLPMAEIRALGGGATQFSIAAGNPEARVRQVDVGVFAQDDWRARPNLTLSLGLRYEAQNNISDWTDFAPRIGFAWAPGGSQQRKTVVRGGFGIFYDRFDEDLVLQARRFNGLNQQQYIVTNPDFFPNVPPLATLAAQQAPVTIRRIDSGLEAPYVLQAAIGIERQLPGNTTLATAFTNTRGVHLLRTRNINAPLPGTFTPGAPSSGVRPFGPGDIFLYESSGVLDQRQWITNINTRFSRNVTLVAFYAYNRAKSNTDGAATLPADPYDLSTEYGRAALDTRHRIFVGGSITAPGGLRFSPFITARSGAPFNITTGRDVNGDTVFRERPAFATDLTKPGVVVTPFGAFDPNPAPGQRIIPRNYAEGPGYFSVNLRVSKTLGFGGSANGPGGPSPPGEGRRGGRRGRGGPGGMRMGGGIGAIFAEGSTEQRYNLTLSVSARNLFNRTNPGPPIGNLTSPFFGTSNSLASSWGPADAAANRRIELQLRFSF